MELHCNRRVIDLSAPLGENTRCYPTDPQFHKSWHVEIADVGANVSKIETGLHAGTHVDVPLHFVEGGADVSMLAIETFFGSAVAINAQKQPGEDIMPDDLLDADIRAGDIVLVRTGWGEKINTKRFFEEGWPGFSVDVIDILVDKGAKAIGGDMPAADNSNGLAAGFPVHKRALSAGLPMYEGLVNLEQVVGKRFLFFGLPLKIEHGEASPVRAIALLEN